MRDTAAPHTARSRAAVPKLVLLRRLLYGKTWSRLVVPARTAS
jgi:hypothetical protein